MRAIRAALALLLGLALGGCASTRASSPARQYVLGENASLCFDEDARLANALLSRENIRDVQPVYALYSSHGSATARLRGAAIEVRDGAGLERDRLANVIECHRQAVARGAVVSPPNDPYALADDEMQVAVESDERGDTIIKLTSRDMTEALEVLARAEALIGRASPVAAR
jgi:phage terminase large subunit-like protein